MNGKDERINYQMAAPYWAIPSPPHLLFFVPNKKGVIVKNVPAPKHMLLASNEGLATGSELPQVYTQLFCSLAIEHGEAGEAQHLLRPYLFLYVKEKK